MQHTELLEKVQQSLNSIRPHLQTDGGDIEVVDITEDYVVKVKLLGACGDCKMSFMTMKAGVEYSVKTAVPEIKAVEAV
ncbi:MAG TPA: NifU family protein [Chitinophagales bacterium]|nr:NifU family protein [Chitinophagales bacterium]HRK28118.1 NifU family protein [Chitinophagales bacterium]